MKINPALIPKTKVIIPWEMEDDNTVQAIAIKWCIGNNSSYEFYIKELNTMTLGPMLSHCDTFINKVTNTVQTVAHRGQSLFINFPHTISTMLQTSWRQVLVEHPVAAQTVDSFNATIRHFIAAHFDPADQHELLQQLRSCKKPKHIPVQTFWYKWRQYNGYVPMLPGNGVPLDEEAECQSLFDAMPGKWQDEHTQSKGLLTNVTLGEMIHFFRTREKISAKAEENNCARQKQDAVEKHSNNGNAAASTTSKHSINEVDPEAHCPLHPDGTHKWKKCFKNPDNPEGYAAKAKAKKAKLAANKNGNGKKDDGHVAEVIIEDKEIPCADQQDHELQALFNRKLLVNDDDIELLAEVLNGLGEGMFTRDESVHDIVVNEVLTHTANLHFNPAQQVNKQDHDFQNSIESMLQD